MTVRGRQVRLPDAGIVINALGTAVVLLVLYFARDALARVDVLEDRHAEAMERMARVEERVTAIDSRTVRMDDKLDRLLPVPRLDVSPPR